GRTDNRRPPTRPLHSNTARFRIGSDLDSGEGAVSRRQPVYTPATPAPTIATSRISDSDRGCVMDDSFPENGNCGRDPRAGGRPRPYADRLQPIRWNSAAGYGTGPAAS